jgi:hypothetical protein
MTRVMPGQFASQPHSNLCGYVLDPYAREQCCAPRRVQEEYWVSGEWLYWSFRNAPVPPLIVTGNPNLPNAGIPGGGNIRALVGPSRDQGMFHGARVTAGTWFDPDGELGVEGAAFLFARHGTTDVFQGSATQPLAVPFQSSTGAFGAYNFSSPGGVTGALGVGTASQLLGAEANLIHRIYSRRGVSIDGLFGYRFLSLTERLDLFGQMQPTGAATTFTGLTVPPGVAVFTTDSFRTRNEFHGGQLGARLEVRRDMFSFGVSQKFGVGANVQTLLVDGNSAASGFGVTRLAPGGVRALPSNGGRDTNDDFSMIYETRLEVGLQVTRHIGLRVGYNLLFWTDVLRPANVISPVLTQSQVPIDPTFSPTPVPNARPVTVFRSSDFLAQGLSVGVVFDW